MEYMENNKKKRNMIVAAVLFLIMLSIVSVVLLRNPQAVKQEMEAVTAEIGRNGEDETENETAVPEEIIANLEGVQQEIIAQNGQNRPLGIEERLQAMSLEEKIYQMFIVTPEALTGQKTVTSAGSVMKQSLEKYPVGGLIFFAKNIVAPEQTTNMLYNTQEYAKEIEGVPVFTCVDEEGGRVARVGNNAAFGVETFDSMRSIQDVDAAYHVGDTIGAYLSKLGFNFDFAPDADVISNEYNTVIGDRSFGSDPQTVTQFAAAVSKGLQNNNVLSTFKHFPGHGGTEGDTHEGFAYTNKTYDELKACEMIPFMAAAKNEVDAVMAAHISVPNLLGDNTPCSLSYTMITEILREDLGYSGLIVTDALNMGAIVNLYSAAEAAVMAVKAGNDLLLMPEDFQAATEGILQAVASGEITEERINQSVRRILKAKMSIMEWSSL